jgi:polyisoprenoid-binding protein YceI
VTAGLWTLSPPDGELLIRTGVGGRAARMGHNLTIAMTSWEATVAWAGTEPVTAELTVEIDSLEVLRGESGVKGLSGPEKALVKSNALKSLGANRYPEIRFAADTIGKTGEGYRLTGKLHIRGKARKHVIALRTEDLGDAWRMSVESSVRQTDYGIKPYSLLMGSVKVGDEVSVSFTAVHAKGDRGD